VLSFNGIDGFEPRQTSITTCGHDGALVWEKCLQASYNQTLM